MGVFEYILELKGFRINKALKALASVPRNDEFEKWQTNKKWEIVD